MGEGGVGAAGEWESIVPVFLDGEAPFPAEVIVFVVVGEFGLDGVDAAGQQPFGRLLDGGEVLVLLRSGAVTPDHVLRLVHCLWGREDY